LSEILENKKKDKGSAANQTFHLDNSPTLRITESNPATPTNEKPDTVVLGFFYSIQRLLNELKLANTLLKTMDGKNSRTYACPCEDKVVEYLNNTFS